MKSSKPLFSLARLSGALLVSVLCGSHAVALELLTEHGAFSFPAFDGPPKRVDDLKAFRIGLANDARAQYLRSRGFTNLVTFDDDREIPKQLGNTIDLWVTQAMRAQETARNAGVGELKPVFASILGAGVLAGLRQEGAGADRRQAFRSPQGMIKDATFRRILRGGVF